MSRITCAITRGNIRTFRTSEPAISSLTKSHDPTHRFRRRRRRAAANQPRTAATLRKGGIADEADVRIDPGERRERSRGHHERLHRESRRRRRRHCGRRLRWRVPEVEPPLAAARWFCLWGLRGILTCLLRPGTRRRPLFCICTLTRLSLYGIAKQRGSNDTLRHLNPVPS